MKFQFFITLDEYERLRAASAVAGCTMSEFVRVALIRRIAQLHDELLPTPIP